MLQYSTKKPFFIAASKVFLFLKLMFVFIGVSCQPTPFERLPNCNDSDLAIVEIQTLSTACLQATGSLAIIVSGGIEPYSFSLNGGEFTSQPTFNNLAAGTYSLVIRDKQLCERSQNATIEPSGLDVTTEVQSSECHIPTGVISITQIGTGPELEYKLNDGEYVKERIFSTLAPGTYKISIRNQEACEIIRTIKVPSNIRFSQDILPIIQSSCAISGCHNGTQAPNFTLFTNVKQNAEQIKANTQNRTMPPGRALPQSQIDAISCWVNDGALEN